MSLHSENVALDLQDAAKLSSMRHQNDASAFDLRMVPMDRVVPHEHYHGGRATDLAERLRAEGKLINPPIVAQYGDKYVVLDGATRLTALRQLGYPSLIVQVVDLSQPQIQLGSWNHVVCGGDASGLLDVLHDIPGLQLSPFTVDESHPGLLPNAQGGHLPHGVLAVVQPNRHEGYWLEALPVPLRDEESQRLHLLNEVVAAYGQWANVERTLSRDVDALRRQFPDFSALILFPRFTTQDILALADRGRTVPAGITRFVIPGRVLRLNAPLEFMAVDAPLTEKQRWLDELVLAKLRGRQVRYYEEPVLLLDE